MKELRTKNTCFQAKPSEAERVEVVAKSLNMSKSEYVRDLVMKDVAKQEKKMKG